MPTTDEKLKASAAKAKRKPPERVVHAWGGISQRIEVVRYDKSGKWWLEWEDGHREKIPNVDDAVVKGLALWYNHNGTVCFDQPGGAVFSRKARALDIERTAQINEQKRHEIANALRILREFSETLPKKHEDRPGVLRAIEVLEHE